MDIFSTLLTLLFIATTIYYIVFFSLTYYWHEKKTTFIIVPAIYAFDFFVAGFLIISVISIIFNYFPELLNFFIK